MLGGQLVACSSGAKSGLIGYTHKTSYLTGELVELKTSVSAPVYLNQVPFELSTVNGEVIYIVQVSTGTQAIPENGSTHGYGWETTARFNAPARSGLYIVGNSIPILVRDSNPGPITVLIETNTIEAYNSAGGQSMYTTPQATRVSFERPQIRNPLPHHSGAMLQWLDTQTDLTISYISDRDMDIDGILDSTELLIIVGHSEYWTRKARQAYDTYLASGRNILLMSGNTMWWEVEYIDNIMVCPKAKSDNWGHESKSYPIENSIASSFANGGYPVDTQGGFKITDSSHEIFNGTGLVNGDILPLHSIELDGHRQEILDGLYSYSILGFDYGKRGSKSDNICNILEFKFTATHGTVLHFPTTDWTSENGIGGEHGDIFKTITRNSINYLMNLGGN